MKLTKKDIYSIIGVISSQCPDAFNFKKAEDIVTLSEFWYNALCEYQKEVVLNATINALKTSDYQKRNWLGAICQEIEKMKGSAEKGGAELWEELTDTFYEVRLYASMLMNTFKDDDGVKQCDKSSAKLKEIYDRLDSAIKEYVRSTSMLIQLARSDSELLSVEKGRFLKVLPQIRERNRVIISMPQEVRLYFSDLNKKIGGGKKLPRLK